MTALQQGLVQPDSVIDTHPYTIDGHRIRDVGYYPELTMTGILQNPVTRACPVFRWRCLCNGYWIPINTLALARVPGLA